MAICLPRADTRGHTVIPGSAHFCLVKAGSRGQDLSVPRRLQPGSSRRGTIARCQPVQPPSYKDLVERRFAARCVEYDKAGNYHYKVAAELVARAGLQPGWNVLDVACGTGLATYLAASEVGQTGSLTGVDISSGMVEQAKAKLQLSPCPNISFSVEDVEHATLHRNSFDAILSSSGMPYLNTSIMFKKLNAWLKPDGLLIYNTPEAPYSPLLTLMHKLLEGYNESAFASPFAWMADEVELLEAAGFHDIKVDRTAEHLLGEAVPLDVYVHRSWQLVGVGLEPFFPCLLTLSEADKQTLKKMFVKEATAIGESLLNADNLVEDKHDSCQVIAYASCAT